MGGAEEGEVHHSMVDIMVSWTLGEAEEGARRLDPYVAEIRDPVHGYIKVTEEESTIIDSLFLQRLRRIHQLAGAYMVYLGGVHTRFEHVLGTMHVAGLIAELIANKVGLHREQIQEIRIVALLHDVGHGPYSHLFEEVLTEKTGLTHEDISQGWYSSPTSKTSWRRTAYPQRRCPSCASGS